MPTASPARRERLRAARGANRAAIVDAAEAALRERPFRELSVEEVTQSAGLARTQFYRHFDDLSDLVLKVTAPTFEDLLRSHERLADIAELDAATLRRAIEPAIDAFARYGPLIRALSEAATHDAAIEAVFDDIQERYIAVTERVVGRAVLAGADIPHPEQTARLLHAGNVSYLIDTFGGTPKVTREVALATVVHAWASVLAAP